MLLLYMYFSDMYFHIVVPELIKKNGSAWTWIMYGLIAFIWFGKYNKQSGGVFYLWEEVSWERALWSMMKVWFENNELDLKIEQAF